MIIAIGRDAELNPIAPALIVELIDVFDGRANISKVLQCVVVKL